MNNIICSSSKTALKVIGINESTIDNLYLSNSYIKAQNTYTLKKCGKVYCKNVTFDVNGQEEFIENASLNLDQEQQ